MIDISVTCVTLDTSVNSFMVVISDSIFMCLMNEFYLSTACLQYNDNYVYMY